MTEILTLVYAFARAAWRRRWLAVGVAWGVALIGWTGLLFIPDRYEAFARVFVDSRTPLKPVLEGIAIEEDYESQVALVREALLSRPQLEAVARSTGLDADVDSTGGLDALIYGLQQEIKVVSISPPSAGGGPARDTLYTIAYQHTDRDLSVKVVQTLLDNFVNGAISGNRAGSAQAQDFLQEQIAELEKRLQAAEERLAEFKKRHIGLIPGDRGDYFTRLDEEMSGLQKAQTDLAVATSRRTELQKQLASQRAYLPGAAAVGAGPAPRDITLRRQEAEQRLEDLLLRFTDRHPEVLALQTTIAELKDREARELADLQRGGNGSGEIRSLSTNPVYQQIQTQLNQVAVEIASFQGAAAQHQQEINTLRSFVNQAPEIEQEYSRLNRDYGVTKAQYDQLVQRREQARVSDDAAKTGIVRFEVIDPPRAPTRPTSPQRELLVLVLLAVALGSGLAVAMLPQLISPTFVDVASLQKRFGVPVLGAVSEIRIGAALARERREARLVILAAASLTVLAGVYVVFVSRAAGLLQSMLA